MKTGEPGATVLINCLSARSGGAVSYLRHAVPLILEQGNGRGSRWLALCDPVQAERMSAARDHLRIVETSRLGGARRILWERRNVPRITAELATRTVFTPYQVAAARTRARSVIMVRNMEPFFHQRYRYSLRALLRNLLLQRATAASLRRADHVIAVSDFVRDWLAGTPGIGADRLTRIYHGRDEFFAERAADDEAEKVFRSLGVTGPFLLTCGSLLPYRRCEDVIDAFGRLEVVEGRSPALVIAGQGNDPAYARMLRQRAGRSPVANRIRFVGHVDRPAMRVLYQRADLVVLATEVEACPNIAIEAMTAGAAIVASDCRPLPEITGPDGARYFPARNVERLADLMQHLPESPGETAGLRMRARSRAAAFSWKECARQTTDLLSRIHADG